MGGYGSGQHTHRLTVEDCRSLDISMWTREGVFKPETGHIGTWAWSIKGKQVASIGYEVYMTENQPYVRLKYKWHDSESFDYTVYLDRTFPHFGGVRWWFKCPNRSCNRRVGKLYLAPGVKYFVCRHCLDLRYTSQREHIDERMICKAQNIRRKLGGSANLVEPFPEKPKGMHWRTYYLLRRKSEYYSFHGLLGGVARLGIRIEA